MKKALSLLLAAVMVFTLAACTNPGGSTAAPSTSAPTSAAPTESQTEAPTEPAPTPGAGIHTYNDYTSTLGANWNPHTYQTTDEAYTLDYTTDALYQFLFNETFDGYKIVPSMALSEPVDVTEAVKAAHPEYNIPEDATKGYAYTIALNPKACWNDGTPIKAVDYVESIKRLIDPKALNYRSADMIAGSFVPANADAYFYQGQAIYSKVGKTATDYLAEGGALDNLYIDCWDFWGAQGYIDENGKTVPNYVSVLDETVYSADGAGDDAFSGKSLYDEYLAPGAGYEAYGPDEFYNITGVWEDNVSFDRVGIYASGEYELTVALKKSLSGFYLLYNANGLTTFLVKTDLYDSLQKEVNDTYTSTYGTSVDTSVSFGPYKITEYQIDKYVQLEKNENWWGWGEDMYKYVDPEDGETYEMFMTDVINCQVVTETATQREMFLKGDLAGYGLQSEDFDTYRNSDYAYVTPQATIFFFIFNGYLSVIQDREAADDFDKTKNDLETLTLQSFRKAVAVSYDKELLCSTISPARSGGYGIIGKGYIYDPDTGAEYRNTDVAKQVLCDFYSVDTSKYADLDAAVASITGYDPVAAKELYRQAFDEALEKGYITDTDNDGKCDQAIAITYSASTISDFISKTMDYLNEKMAEATKDTPFEGKITFEAIAFGNDWSDKIRSGQADTVLGGWNGSLLDPYSVITCYTDPARSYDAKWFDPKSETMTATVNGEEITMTLFNWGECLNGADVDGHNFGSDAVDQDTRLGILAALEARILQTYDYIPMMQNAGMSLLSKKLFYVTEEYNAVLGRGGITYMKYNYDDAEWTDYVKSEGGQLKY